MKQPSTASFESVQKLAPVNPSTAMTAMKHVAHRSETADLSRGPQENRRSDRTPQDQGPDPRIAVTGEGQLWQSEAGPRVCSPIMPGRTDWFVQTLEKSTYPSHQMYIQYVEKRLNSEIKQDVKPTSSKISLVRDARNGKADPSGEPSDKPRDAESESGQPDDADRDVHAGVAASRSKSECQERAVGSASEPSQADSIKHDMDSEYQHHGQNNHYLSHVRRLDRKFEQELQIVANQVESHGQNRGPRIDLLEVVCSAESELTSQVRKLGGRAERFGRVQGDLQTPEGRKKLFALLATQRPNASGTAQNASHGAFGEVLT